MLKLKKMSIPLCYFKKLSALYPAQVKYLEQYHNIVKNTLPINSFLLEEIGTLLAKPHIPCPITSYDYSIDYTKFQKHHPAEKPITNPVTISVKPNLIQKLFGKRSN